MWPQIFCGFAFLLLGSFLDNSRGPLVPVLTRELGLDYSRASWFLVAGFLAAIAFTLATLLREERLSERRLAALSAALALGAVGLAFGVRGPATLVAAGVLLGAAISGTGSVSNLLVLQGTPDALKPRMMCLLHAMYGLGSFLGPIVVGVVERSGWAWPVALGLAGPLIAAVGLAAYRVVPDTALAPAGGLGRRPLTAAQWWLVLNVCSYVAGEVLISTWMVTYLVEYRGFTVSQAVPYATGFFIVLGLSRVALALTVRPAWERPLLLGSVAAAAVCFVAGLWGWLPGFAAAGVLGPYFPLTLARAGRRFPAMIRKVTLAIIGGMQVTLATLHFTVGRLTDTVGIGVAYWLPALFLGLAVVTLLVTFRGETAEVAVSAPTG